MFCYNLYKLHYDRPFANKILQLLLEDLYFKVNDKPEGWPSRYFRYQLYFFIFSKCFCQNWTNEYSGT